MSWTPAEIRTIRSLAAQGLLFSEIAQHLGRSPAPVRYIAKRYGIRSRARHRIGEWNVKHAHLRERVLSYFLSHTWEQTRAHFELSKSELKSLFTAAYRDPKLRHFRKDTRTHRSWTVDELRGLIRYSGLQPREWIAQKLKRGRTMHPVKERIQQMGAGVKYLNGMPAQWAHELLGELDLPASIKTKAGPTGCTRRGSDFRYRIIPWAEMERAIRWKRIKPEVRQCIQAMAKFQRWVFGLKQPGRIRREIETIVRER